MNFSDNPRTMVEWNPFDGHCSEAALERTIPGIILLFSPRGVSVVFSLVNLTSCQLV